MLIPAPKLRSVRRSWAVATFSLNVWLESKLDLVSFIAVFRVVTQRSSSLSGEERCVTTLITAAKETKPDRAYRHNRCWNLGCQGKGVNGGLVSLWLGHGLAQSRRSKAISLLHSVN